MHFDNPHLSHLIFPHFFFFLSLCTFLPGGRFDQRAGAAAHLSANVDVPLTSKMSNYYLN